MQGYRLPDHVGFGLVEDEPVFLDLNRDRYFRLDPKAKADFQALLRATGSNAQRTRFSKHLIETGLLVAAAEPSLLGAARCDLPEASALDLPDARARPPAWLVAEAWLRLLWIQRQLRRRRLASMIDALRTARRRHGFPEEGPDRTETLAARFIAARRMVPAAPNCLPDSLALSFFLARHSLNHALVFGVKLNPFAAHCLDMRRRL